MLGQDGTTVELVASTRQVAAARRFVRRALSGRVPDDVSSDLQLMVSELFTNAVQYGHAQSVTLTVDVQSDGAEVTVDSASPAPEIGSPDSWHVADETAVTGRGLGIVRQLADVVRVAGGADRFAVTVRRSFTADTGGHRSRSTGSWQNRLAT